MDAVTLESLIEQQNHNVTSNKKPGYVVFNNVPEDVVKIFTGESHHIYSALEESEIAPKPSVLVTITQELRREESLKPNTPVPNWVPDLFFMKIASTKSQNIYYQGMQGG